MVQPSSTARPWTERRRCSPGSAERVVVVLPDREPSRSDRQLFAPHEVVGVARSDAPLPEPHPADPAYLLFTSGSTGRPKGVLVRQANVRAFLDAISSRYDLHGDDRLSQLFDLTFDLSVFDLFAAWEHGACVCSPTPKEPPEPVVVRPIGRAHGVVLRALCGDVLTAFPCASPGGVCLTPAEPLLRGKRCRRGWPRRGRARRRVRS